MTIRSVERPHAHKIHLMSQTDTCHYPANWSNRACVGGTNIACKTSDITIASKPIKERSAYGH